jgi:copper chaperone
MMPARRLKMETVQFEVSGVKCQGCVNTISNGVGGMNGVTEVAVDIPSGNVTVTGESLDSAAITAKLAQLGYPVKDS